MAYNSLDASSNESGEVLLVTIGVFWTDVNDYIYVEAYQSSGSNKNITAAGSTTAGYDSGWLVRVAQGEDSWP